ncbi:hypothetical protein GTNG_3382 [Geobacillus thermodenitrificans NG80-2]|uniref:Uncharacterized protein n=1 Tax=Geobacillus thermodenitrificans (strain NG80-2) TaxID=420246 RepID=A4ITR5_GEOTN|nr:hypothetical protein GTNG_3382 [Geobacillus thermodenitrificans NG80-2]
MSAACSSLPIHCHKLPSHTDGFFYLFVMQNRFLPSRQALYNDNAWERRTFCELSRKTDCFAARSLVLEIFSADVERLFYP